VYLTDSDFCRKCGLSRAKMEEKLREMAMTPRSRKKKTDEHKESFHKRRVETDADGMTTVTEFDDDFTVISTHHYNSSETNQSESYEGMTPRSRKSKHHESYFRTVTETDSNGKMTVTEYDSDGRIVTQTVTDEHGTVDSSTVTCDCGSQYSTLVDFCQFCGLAKSELEKTSSMSRSKKEEYSEQHLHYRRTEVTTDSVTTVTYYDIDHNEVVTKYYTSEQTEVDYQLPARPNSYTKYVIETDVTGHRTVTQYDAEGTITSREVNGKPQQKQRSKPMSVPVPAGCKPGDRIKLSVCGIKINVIIPEDKMPGDLFKIMPPRVDRVDEVQVISIAVPEDTEPGEMITFSHGKGNRRKNLTLIVPKNKKPGDIMKVTLYHNFDKPAKKKLEQLPENENPSCAAVRDIERQMRQKIGQFMHSERLIKDAEFPRFRVMKYKCQAKSPSVMHRLMVDIGTRFSLKLEIYQKNERPNFEIRFLEYGGFSIAPK